MYAELHGQPCDYRLMPVPGRGRLAHDAVDKLHRAQRFRQPEMLVRAESFHDDDDAIVVWRKQVRGGGWRQSAVSSGQKNKGPARAGPLSCGLQTAYFTKSISRY